jgi:hypothetical protein
MVAAQGSRTQHVACQPSLARRSVRYVGLGHQSLTPLPQGVDDFHFVGGIPVGSNDYTMVVSFDR